MIFSVKKNNAGCSFVEVCHFRLPPDADQNNETYDMVKMFNKNGKKESPQHRGDVRVSNSGKE